MKERYEELKRIIEEANKAYYVYDNPSLSDYEYDKYMQELLAIEEKYPELKTEDSPSNKVGGEILDKFTKVNHDIEMKSLADLFSYDEVRDYDESIKKVVGNQSYHLELKIDGLAVSLIYINGVLTEASTRGNGVIGENITNNVKTIKSIPLRLNSLFVPERLEVRGEIFMPLKSFNGINAQKEKDGEELFKNARNAAAGTIRQLDSSVVAKRGLDCFLYYLMEPEKYGVKTQKEAIEFMSNLGFKTNPYSKKVDNIADMLDYIGEVDELRKTLPYDTDGVVIKVNNFDTYKKIGETVKYPKWAIAYKFSPLEVLTQIKDIIFQVGRTGVIKPVALFNPVIISGSLVSRATLNNEDYIISKDIRIGDYVYVRKAAEIIPEVVRVELGKRESNLPIFSMPKACPKCGKPLIRKEGEADYYCLNEDCEARKIESLIHFASRPAYDITGLGEKIIEFLYNEGFIKTIVDIFKLKNFTQELLSKEGFKEKKVFNLIDSIEESKKKSLEFLIFALGIRNCGAKVSKILAKKYKTLDNLMNASFIDLCMIDDIGDVIASSITDYFSVQANIDMINELKELGLNMNYLGQETENDIFSGKTFVLTGTLPSLSRDEASQLIEDRGGTVSSSVSKKTDYVLYGDMAGSTLKKAQELNIKLITEEEFMNMLK